MVMGLFGVGFWMVDLTYYHAWYQSAPNLHKSVGFVLFVFTLLRLTTYWVLAKPQPLNTHSRIEVISAKLVHRSLLALLFVLFFSGYLITTAQGDALYIFNVLAIPSTLNGIDQLENYAGDVHKYTAYALIGLAAVHAIGALKHHFYDKDATLKRMLGIKY